MGTLPKIYGDWFERTEGDYYLRHRQVGVSVGGTVQWVAREVAVRDNRRQLFETFSMTLDKNDLEFRVQDVVNTMLELHPHKEIQSGD